MRSGCADIIIYVTVFWKTDRMVTNTEIHFLPVDECHTHTLSRDTVHLRIDGQVCFCRRLFCDAVEPRGCISWPACVAPELSLVNQTYFFSFYIRAGKKRVWCNSIALFVLPDPQILEMLVWIELKGLLTRCE